MNKKDDKTIDGQSSNESANKKPVLKDLDNITKVELIAYWGTYAGSLSATANLDNDDVNIETDCSDFAKMQACVEAYKSSNFNKKFVKTKQSLIDILNEVKIQNWVEHYSSDDFVVME